MPIFEMHYSCRSSKQENSQCSMLPLSKVLTGRGPDMTNISQLSHNNNYANESVGRQRRACHLVFF